MLRPSMFVGGLCLFVLAVTFLAPAITEAVEPNLVTAFFVKGKVGLKWRMIDGVSDYIVYRKSDADFVQVATSSEDHYFDVNIVPGATYVYKVAITEGGTEVFSSERSVSIPEQVGDFKPPIWVGLRVDGDRVMLNWDPVPNAVAYNVFRSVTPGEGHEIVGNSQGSRFADRGDLERGTTYYYVLSALNADFEDTELSEELSIQFGMSAEDQKALLAEQSEIQLETVTMTELFKITEAGAVGAMNQPADVFLNSKGDIYVTDTLNTTVHCFDGQGQYKHSFGEKSEPDRSGDHPDGTFLFPFTLFVDKNDEVYVSDVKRNDIQVFTADGEFLRRIQVDTGDGAEALRPNGLHVLDDGRLVITDSGNHRFLITDAAGKIQKAVGGRGDKPGQFNFPDELMVTDAGEIHIVDVINCRVQIFDLDGQFLRTFGEVGQGAGTFGRPKGIAVDEQRGRIWVSESMGNLLQGFTVEGEIKSILGGADDQWSFASPRGLFFREGRLYVVNRLHNEVLVFLIG